MVYFRFLKTGSLDNAIGEFSLAQLLWVMAYWTMLCSTNMVCIRKNFSHFCLHRSSLSLFFWWGGGGVKNETVFPLAILEDEMIIANTALAICIYILISNARSWNNCLLVCLARSLGECNCKRDKYASRENANARKDTRRIQQDTVFLVDVSTAWLVAYVQVKKELDEPKLRRTVRKKVSLLRSLPLL